MTRHADTEIVVPMSVDVDGAPKSYGPPGSDALDYELNAHRGAKSTGEIVGYMTDSHGRPIIQGPNDPAPGFYISTTSFQDISNRTVTDPRRYVNAAEINYTMLARGAKAKGVRLGDFCVVHSIEKDTTVYAIVGDAGHSSGAEGSLALLQRLGYKIKNGKSIPSEQKPTQVVVRYFSDSNHSHTFFFSQADLDKAASALNLDTDFSAFHKA